MNKMSNMITLLVVLNIMMYLAINFTFSAEGENQLNEKGNFQFKGDLIDTFMGGYNNLQTITDNTKDGNWTSYGIKFNETFENMPTKAGGEVIGSGLVIYQDPLAILWSFILTIGNIITAPLTLFFNFRMPVFIGLIIGIPYFIMLSLTLFALIRGVSD